MLGWSMGHPKDGEGRDEGRSVRHSRYLLREERCTQVGPQT